MSEEQRYSCAGTDVSASLGPQAVIETNNCLRGSFSLRCDSVETQLVYANLLVLLNTALWVQHLVCVRCMCSIDLLQSSFMLSSHPVLPVFRDLSVFNVINTEKLMKLYIKDRASGLHILMLSVLSIIPVLNSKRLRPHHKVLKHIPCPELVLAEVLCF